MNDRNEMKGWQQMMAELTERAADKSALRTYAMTHRMFCPQWLADEGYCEAIDTMLTTFLPAVGWNYERQFYLRDVSFNPYTELPVRALADCLLAERVAHPQRRTYSVEQLLYGYMRGGFPLQADGKDICKELDLLTCGCPTPPSMSGAMTERAPSGYPAAIPFNSVATAIAITP